MAAFGSRRQATGAIIAPGHNHLRTAGYDVEGDGGAALYVRAAKDSSAIGGFRSADRFLPDGSSNAANGGWWTLAERDLDFRVFGARATAGVLADQQSNVDRLRNALAYFETAGGGKLRVDELYEFDSNRLSNNRPQSGDVSTFSPRMPPHTSIIAQDKLSCGFKVTGDQNCCVLRVEGASGIRIRLGLWGNGVTEGNQIGAIAIVQPDDATAEMVDLEFDLFLSNFKADQWVSFTNNSHDKRLGAGGFAIRHVRIVNPIARSFDGNSRLPTHLGSLSTVFRFQGVAKGPTGTIEDISFERGDLDCYGIKSGIAIFTGVKRVRILDTHISNNGRSSAFVADSLAGRVGILIYSNVYAQWQKLTDYHLFNSDIEIVRCTFTMPAECGIYVASSTRVSIADIFVSGQSSTATTNAFGTLPRAAIALNSVQHARITRPSIDDCHNGIFWSCNVPTADNDCIISNPRVTNIKQNGSGIRLHASAGPRNGIVSVIDPYIQASNAGVTGLFVTQKDPNHYFKELTIDAGQIAATFNDILFYAVGEVQRHGNTLVRNTVLSGTGGGMLFRKGDGLIRLEGVVAEMGSRGNARGFDIGGTSFDVLLNNGARNRTAPSTTPVWNTEGASARRLQGSWFSNVDARLRVAPSPAALGLGTPSSGQEGDYIEFFTPRVDASLVTHGQQYMGGAWRPVQSRLNR